MDHTVWLKMELTISKRNNKMQIDGTLSSTAPAWDQNYNPTSDRYEIAYFFENIPKFRQDQIENKFSEFSESTCVNFIKIESAESAAEFKNRIKIIRGGGCWSYVGRQMEVQPLSLDFGCADWVTLHEGMHALGWWHEQQRGDRQCSKSRSNI